MVIVSIILGLIISLLIIEKQLTQKNVSGLKLRVLINGTRGKSSVTEYIAAGLSNSQTDVMGKITGIIPTVIYKGKPLIIKRSGVARVQEQVNIIRLAARKKVKSLVLECMSIAPELQKLESLVFKPHIYVITNIRDDHREGMGKNIEEQACSICDAIPQNCTVITNEIRFINKIMESAEIRSSIVISLPEIGQETYSWLPDGVFSENVSLALAVCRAAGIDNNLAEEGIKKWISESNSPISEIWTGEKKIMFLDAFSVNDIDSTEYFINYWMQKTGYQGKISIVLNTRADRPVRTDLFVRWLSGKSATIEFIIVTGDHSNRAEKLLIKYGVDKDKILVWREKKVKNFKENLLETINNGSLVIGVGNIGRSGVKILNGLK